VHFTGLVDARFVPDYLAAIDIAMIPACATHASPMKLVEFMALGLPVIAPDQANIREILTNGINGRLFTPADPESLRRCLLELLSNPTESDQIGRNAKEYVLANLTWDKHARTVLEALRRFRPPMATHDENTHLNHAVSQPC
jgi:glycosyltransferase involved in cell wall biosynthesis